MISELLLGLAGALAVAAMLLVSLTIIKTLRACKQFKITSKGMPMAAGFSPITGHLTSIVFKKDLNNETANLPQQTGDTFFIMFGQRPFVVTVDLDLIKGIVLEEQQVNINRTSLDIPIREVKSDCIMLASGDQWRRLRRPIAQALTKSKFSTANVSREINDSIDKLMSSLERKIEQSPGGRIDLDVDDYFHRYSLDLTLSCLYKQNNIVDFDSEHDEWTRILDLGYSDFFNNRLVAVPIAFPIIGHLIDKYLINWFKLGSLRQRILDFIKLQTKANLEARKELQLMRAKGKDRDIIDEESLTLSDGSKFKRNMIDHVIDHYHDGKISKAEYFHSTFFLLTAADKTSADALSQTLYLLALNRDKQQKLRESIRIEGIHSTYLSWVMNESLRLHPPATIGCSRTVERDTETRHGYIIPKGTFVVTPAFAIHRLEKYWGKDVNEFRPERFADHKSFHACQFIPFGAGLRQCPGKDFALFEMKLLLSQLLTKYEFSCRPKTTEAYDVPFFILCLPHEPAIITVTRLSADSCDHKKN